MKRQFTLLFVLALFSSALSAQIAVRGGLNYSQVSVDGSGVDLGTDPKPGFHLGLQGNIGLPGLLSVRPALLYHLKGGKGEDVQGDTDLSYFEVPLNLGINLGTDGAKIIIEGGPYFGYLVNASSDFISDPGDNLDKVDWGANFGAVVELSSLGIGINYSNGLSNIAKEDRLSEAVKLKNGNLSIFAYLKF